MSVLSNEIKWMRTGPHRGDARAPGWPALSVACRRQIPMKLIKRLFLHGYFVRY
jgi:hypothetical protein